MKEKMLQYFTNAGLTDAEANAVAAIDMAAFDSAERLPDTPETLAVLRMMLEARNSALKALRGE